MYKITDRDVEFILGDIKARGVVLEDLQDNLLDHICCIIEDEMKEEEDFMTFYESVLPKFFKEELKEIQVETENLLRFKNFYSMKKILKISGIATVVFTVLGALLKTFHLPGAGVCIVLGGFLLSLIFLPLLIAIKFKDEESKIDKWVFSFGLFVGMGLSAGLIFKLMHWPGAYMLMISSTVLFTFVYVPIYFISRVKRPELRFNTIVNTVLMMACGGIFYALFDLSYSHKYHGQMSEDHVYMHGNSERLFASNDLLYEYKSLAKDGDRVNNITQEVDDALEKVVSNIIVSKHPTTASSEIDLLITKADQYNSDLSGTQLEQIDMESLKVLKKLKVELAMNVLARTQQLLAINENVYLISTLNKR